MTISFDVDAKEGAAPLTERERGIISAIVQLHAFTVQQRNLLGQLYARVGDLGAVSVDEVPSLSAEANREAIVESLRFLEETFQDLQVKVVDE